MWHFAEGMNPPDDLFFTQSNSLMQLGQAWNDVETADSLNYFMGLAVNGDPSVMELVREFKDINADRADLLTVLGHGGDE